MKNIFRKTKSQLKRASAQILGIVVFLALATLALVTALDQSLLNIETSRQQAETELSKIRALDSMTVIAAVLVEMVNRTIAIKQDGDVSASVSPYFENALLNAGKTVADFDAAVEANTADVIASLNPGTVSGVNGFFKIFNEDEFLYYDVQCLSNCNAHLEYPKVFSLTLKEYSKQDKGISTTIKTSGEVERASLSDFSLVAWGETREEVLIGPTEQAKVNISFDFDNIVPNGDDDDGDGVIDNPEEFGRVRFLTAPGTEVYMEQFFTNTSLANLMFGAYSCAGHYGCSWSGSDGEIEIPRGVSIGAPQNADIQSAIMDLVPTAIQGTLAPETVEFCTIQLGCSSSSTCRITMWETVFGDGTPQYVVNDQPIQPNGAYYSPAAAGCVLERHAIQTSPTDRIFLGGSKAVFIAANSFRLRMSLVDHPDLSGQELGAKVFASINKDALLFDQQTMLLNGRTMGEVWDNSSFEVDAGDTGLILNAGLVAVDALSGPGEVPQNVKPFAFDQGTLDPPTDGASAKGSYGLLQTDGPMMGPSMTVAKLVNTSTGERRVGFEGVDASYSNHWLTDPPDVFDQGTSSAHLMSFEGMSATSADLYLALQMVGQEFDPNFDSPPDDLTGPGGGGSGFGDQQDKYVADLQDFMDSIFP